MLDLCPNFDNFFFWFWEYDSWLRRRISGSFLLLFSHTSFRQKKPFWILTLFIWGCWGCLRSKKCQMVDQDRTKLNQKNNNSESKSHNQLKTSGLSWNTLYNWNLFQKQHTTPQGRISPPILIQSLIGYCNDDIRYPSPRSSASILQIWRYNLQKWVKIGLNLPNSTNWHVIYC